MNLKTAARRLGIHYQTAYKLVRTGRLTAVRIGGAYEISDAAIEQYLAERSAMGRVPAMDIRTPEERGEEHRDVLSGARRALDATLTTARPVLEVAAELLADEIGDLAIVRPMSRDGDWLLPGVVRHNDPRRRSIAAVAVEEFPQPLGTLLFDDAVTERRTVLRPHVPQDFARDHTLPELVQFFDEAGIHSLVATPAVAGEQVMGVVAIARDCPGRPYTGEDVSTVEQVAAIVGAALERARLAGDAWTRRRSLMQRVAAVLDDGAAVLGADDLVHTGEFAELVCDAEGRIVLANDIAARLLHCEARALVGRCLHDLAPAADQEDFAAGLRRLLVGELAYLDGDRNVCKQDGRVITVSAHIGVLRDVLAQPRALVVIAHSVPQIRLPRLASDGEPAADSFAIF